MKKWEENLICIDCAEYFSLKYFLESKEKTKTLISAKTAHS